MSRGEVAFVSSVVLLLVLLLVLACYKRRQGETVGRPGRAWLVVRWRAFLRPSRARSPVRVVVMVAS